MQEEPCVPFETSFGEDENFIHFYDIPPNCDVALAQAGWQVPFCRPLKPPQIKDHYVLHFVRSGKGCYRLKDRTYRIVPGTCFLIYPDQPTVYYADQSSKWEYFWVGLVGRDVEQILSTIGFSPEHQVLHFTNYDIFEPLPRILSSAIRYKDDPLGLWLSTTPMVYSLLFSLVEESRAKTLRYQEHILEDNSHLMNQCYLGNKYVKLATQYIEKHFREPITVEDVANVLHINRSYLSTLYKVNTHISLKQYLQQYRILRAAIMLRISDASITEIAVEVGFKDPLYFSRVFKNHMDCSPTEYRAQYK